MSDETYLISHSNLGASPSDVEVYPLRGKLLGHCPYCGRQLKPYTEEGVTALHCEDWICKWDPSKSEEANRREYAQLWCEGRV